MLCLCCGGRESGGKKRQASKICHKPGKKQTRLLSRSHRQSPNDYTHTSNTHTQTSSSPDPIIGSASPSPASAGASLSRHSEIRHPPPSKRENNANAGPLTTRYKRVANCSPRDHGQRPRSVGGGGGVRGGAGDDGRRRCRQKRQAGERGPTTTTVWPRARLPCFHRPPPPTAARHSLSPKHAAQDDKTSADYYFDSYSHFGERTKSDFAVATTAAAAARSTLTKKTLTRKSPPSPHKSKQQASTRRCSRTPCAPAPT